MKKLLLFLAIMVAFVANAQLVTRTLGAGVTYDFNAAAYTITNTTAGFTLYKVGPHYPTTQDYIVRLDSVSGNHTNVAVVLRGRKFDGAAWTTISTVNWKGTTADTTIVISNATAARYRDFSVLFTGTGTGVTRASNHGLKLYLE